MIRNMRSFVAQAYRQSKWIGSHRSFCTQNVAPRGEFKSLLEKIGEKVKKIDVDSSFGTGVFVYGAYELYQLYQLGLERMDKELLIKQRNLEAVEALRGKQKK